MTERRGDLSERKIPPFPENPQKVVGMAHQAEKKGREEKPKPPPQHHSDLFVRKHEKNKKRSEREAIDGNDQQKMMDEKISPSPNKDGDFWIEA